MLKFFRIPFALIGTRAAVPDVDPGDNSVNYEEGFTLPYELPKTNPASLNIPRNQTNQIYFDLSNELALLQAHGTPDYITSALNGGTPYAYSIGDRVRYDDGTNGPRVFVSRVDTNTALPTVAANWSPVRDTTPYAVVAGTANALTAALSPSLGLIPAGTMFLLRHAAANTGAVTLALNGGPAKAVVRSNDIPLGAGNIPGAGSIGLYVYDLTLDKYVLLNPAPNDVIGVAQTWQNLTGSRTAGTTYTNTTTRPIAVFARAVVTSASNALNLTVAGVLVSSVGIGITGSTMFVFGIVPPGATYSVTATGSASLDTWSELR